MLKHWIIFIAIAIFVLITIPYLKYLSKSKTKAKITPEMEKQANIKTVLYILFYWLCDLFYMSLFIDNFACKYIFGGLIMIVVFVNLSKIVSFPNSKSIIQIIGMVQDFIIGVGLSIYLIYIIPNKELQNIVIPIVSAVYGGLITLAGVSLGIKKSDKDRKEDEIKKARPLVFMVDPHTISYDKEQPIKRYLLSHNNRGSLKCANKRQTHFILPHIAITNSDYSHCVMIGFRINNDYHLYDIGQVLSKNSLMILRNDFIFSIKEDKIDYIALLIEDMLDNIYELELNFSIAKDKKENIIQIVSGIELKPTTLNLNAKEI